MDWKEIAMYELKQIRELVNYISDDLEANQRLRAIRDKVDAALEAIENIEDSQ